MHLVLLSFLLNAKHTEDVASGALTGKPLSNIRSLGNDVDEWHLTSRNNKGKSVAVLNSLALSGMSNRNTKIQ